MVKKKSTFWKYKLWNTNLDVEQLRPMKMSCSNEGWINKTFKSQTQSLIYNSKTQKHFHEAKSFSLFTKANPIFQMSNGDVVWCVGSLHAQLDMRLGVLCWGWSWFPASPPNISPCTSCLSSDIFLHTFFPSTGIFVPQAPLVPLEFPNCWCTVRWVQNTLARSPQQTPSILMKTDEVWGSPCLSSPT